MQAYAASIKGLWKFEVQDWQTALDQFAAAKSVVLMRFVLILCRSCRSIFQKLAETGSAEDEVLCHHRMDIIEPITRYCVYHLQHEGQDFGSQSLEEILAMRTQTTQSDVLQSKIEVCFDFTVRLYRFPS